MTTLPIDIGFYESSSLPLAAQSCINLYPQNPQTKGASSPGVLFHTPGISQVATAGTGANRGMVVHLEEVYAVQGGTLFKIDALGVATDLGLISGTGRVSMASNGVVLAIIVPGGNGYFLTGASLAVITDPTFAAFQAQKGGVTSVTYKDGFFVYTTDVEFFNGSLVTVNSGRDFDALDFGTAEVKPDDNVRAFVVKNELYIFGEQTIELFQNIGGTGFPFQRIPGAVIDKGLFARFGLIEFDNSFVFVGGGVGEGPGIWRGGSGSASKISTPAVDEILQALTRDDLESIFAWSYAEGGSFFAGFTLPAKTLVYDVTASTIQQRPVWHERSTGGSRWRVNDIVDAYGIRVVSDNVDGRIGALDRTFFSDYGEAVTRSFSGAYLYNQGNSFFISELKLKTESGVGNAVEPDPQLELQFSDDGGRNFVSVGSRALGKASEFEKRQIWRRLGRSPSNRVFKFLTSDPVKISFLNMEVEIIGGF